MGGSLVGAIFFFLVAVLHVPFTSFLPFCQVKTVLSSVACWELPAEVTDVHLLWGFCCGFISLVLVSSLLSCTLCGSSHGGLWQIEGRPSRPSPSSTSSSLLILPLLLLTVVPQTSELLTGSQVPLLKCRPSARCLWWFLPRVTFSHFFQSMEPFLVFHSLGFEDFFLC